MAPDSVVKIEGDDLHFKKNRPDHPEGYAPGDFPAYVYKPYPKWIYHEKEAAKIIHDETELANHRSRGWVENPNDTRAAYEASELEKSNNAAQRAADDRRMSDTAKAEHDAADSAADDHVLDLPAGKLDKKRVRQSNAADSAADGKE